MACVWADETVTSKVHLLVLLALADHSNDDGVSYPSIDRLAMKTRLSVRSVHDALSELRSEGKIEIDYKKGPCGTNVYRLLATPCTPCTVQSSPENSGTRLHPIRKEPSGTTKGGDKKSFTPPSVEEITRYCEEMNFPADLAAPIWDFYESKGWKVGKVAMRDWKAAVRNWARRNQPQQRPMYRSEIRLAIDILRRKISRHPGNHESLNFTNDPTEYQNCQSLRDELAKLETDYLNTR